MTKKFLILSISMIVFFMFLFSACAENISFADGEILSQKTEIQETINTQTINVTDTMIKSSDKTLNESKSIGEITDNKTFVTDIQNSEGNSKTKNAPKETVKPSVNDTTKKTEVKVTTPRPTYELTYDWYDPNKEREGVDIIYNFRKPTLEDNFKEDIITIVFKHAYSVPNREWKPEEFPGINVESVEDLTYYHNLETALVNWAKFHQIIRVHLKDKSKEKVLEAIDVLEQRRDVLCAEVIYDNVVVEYNI